MSAIPKTYEDLDNLVPADVAKHLHIIVGPNGQCLCGVYDGRATVCWEIAAMQFPVIRDAIVMDNLVPGGIPIDEHGKPKPLLP